MEKTIFSKNLSTYLFANGLTNRDVGERVGLSGQAVSNWLNSDRLPQLDTLSVLAGLMAVSIDDLINRDLTYQIIRESGYSDLVTDQQPPIYGQKDSRMEELVTHIRTIQRQMEEMIDANKRVLSGVDG